MRTEQEIIQKMRELVLAEPSTEVAKEEVR
jgi:hypothetical protein